MADPDSRSTEDAAQGDPTTVRFHYLKSNLFRVVHVDGAIGGLTPTGFVQMALYSDRLPIPKVTVHELDGANLGEEKPEARVTRDGLVREIEMAVLMDLRTTIALRDWLDDKIERFTEVQKSVESFTETRGSNGG